MSEASAPEQVTVPVDGGQLSVLHWPAEQDGAPLVVLLHDLLGNGLVWAEVAAALGGTAEVVAPDLRGRAGSAGLPEPYGVQAHADDLTAVLQQFGAGGQGRTAVLAGHGLGAFVAALAADGVARDRVGGLVLVEGGPAFPQPAVADADAALGALLGPAVDALDERFADLAAVRAFWAGHPAIGPWVDTPSVAAALARDVAPADGGWLRTAAVHEAVRFDASDILFNERVLEALDDLPVPATFLWATRGPQDQRPGLYDDGRLAGLGLELQRITAREVRDTNHSSIVWAPQGVEAIAGAIRAAAHD